MSRTEPTRAEMVEELLAVLERLRGYRVEVRLQPAGGARPVALTVPPQLPAGPPPAPARPRRRARGPKGNAPPGAAGPKR